ncbi:hypothetical protein D3C75_793610 [compost metagenome]
MGFIDVGMLVSNGVSGVVPDEFDGHIELIFATHTVTFGGHFWPASDGISPAKAGNLRFHRVRQHRHAFNGDGVGGLACATVTAIDTHVAGQNRQHGDGS